MLDATFVKEIDRLAKDGVRASVLALPLEPVGTYAVVSAAGVVDRKLAAPAWHAEKLKTPGALNDFIKHRVEPGADTISAIYLSDSEVVFIYDQPDRRDRATCTLEWAEPFLTLQTFDAAAPSENMLTHDAMIRLLRIIFRGCFPKEILDTLRSVKFTSGSEASATVKNSGGESMGSAIRQATAGQKDLPEEIILHVPVYANHPFQVDVWCALEVFSSTQRFRLTPYPGEVEKATALALDDIAGVFDAEGPPVYRGSVL